MNKLISRSAACISLLLLFATPASPCWVEPFEHLQVGTEIKGKVSIATSRRTPKAQRAQDRSEWEEVVTPIENASVLLYSTTLPYQIVAKSARAIDPEVEPVSKTRTDEKGDFNLPNLAPGWYEIVVYSKSQPYHQVWAYITVTGRPDHDSTTVDIVLKHAGQCDNVSIRGRAAERSSPPQ